MLPLAEIILFVDRPLLVLKGIDFTAGFLFFPFLPVGLSKWKNGPFDRLCFPDFLLSQRVLLSRGKGKRGGLSAVVSGAVWGLNL